MNDRYKDEYKDALDAVNEIEDRTVRGLAKELLDAIVELKDHAIDLEEQVETLKKQKGDAHADGYHRGHADGYDAGWEAHKEIERLAR